MLQAPPTPCCKCQQESRSSFPMQAKIFKARPPSWIKPKGNAAAACSGLWRDAAGRNKGNVDFSRASVPLPLGGWWHLWVYDNPPF